MTKPSEKFIEWANTVIPENDEPISGMELDYQLRSIKWMWLAYLKGRDERSTVKPELIVKKFNGIDFTHQCECSTLVNKYFIFCDQCGAKLDWSE
jgi:hypothetical protein